jgi:ubiquinone/menaquinone biosynthesis C-methylase UbiE
MNVDFAREQSWWDAKASKEENDLADEAINRALRWREIDRHLTGIRSILDVGGGTGAFSIPLARRGFRVTHLDFSQAMLSIARGKSLDLSNISFLRANAVALPFPDRSFDLVMNADGAVSFCGVLAGQAIAEACRVTRKVLFLAVSNRALLIPVFVAASIQVSGGIMPAVPSMFDRGEWHQDQFPDNHLLSRGMTQDYCGPLKAFTPDELRAVLAQEGLKVLRCGGLGTLANLCGDETLQKVLADEALFGEFVALCEQYDHAVLPNGTGTRQRAGLVTIAVRTTGENDSEERNDT